MSSKSHRSAVVIVVESGVVIVVGSAVVIIKVLVFQLVVIVVLMVSEQRPEILAHIGDDPMFTVLNITLQSFLNAELSVISPGGDGWRQVEFTSS